MMNDENKSDEAPELIVDTDWKEQVAKEREQAAAERAQAESPSESKGAEPEVDSGEAPSPVPAAESPGTGEPGQLPPPPEASFDVLVSMLFTQGMAFLGQMPNPATGKAEVNKAYAKHYIDTLELLGQKTEGNLSEDESKMLSEVLHALRMTFVSVKG
jgi:hypothetical protein